MVGDDLVDGPLPAQEPEAALAMLDCRLQSADSCALIEEALLALPGAWHRIGYTVHVDFEPTQSCASIELKHHRGRRARRAAAEIWVYPDWSTWSRSWPTSAVTSTWTGPWPPPCGPSRTRSAMHQTCSEEQTELAAYRDARVLQTSAPRRGHGPVDRSNSSVAEDSAETAPSHLLAVGNPLRTGNEPSTCGNVRLRRA